MTNRILITKERVDNLQNNCDYYPLLKTTFCVNYRLFELISSSKYILISSIKGVYSLLYNIELYPSLKPFFAMKNFITIGSKSHQLLRDIGFSCHYPFFYNAAHLSQNIQFNNKIAYLSGFNTVFSDDLLQKVQRIILYRSYLIECSDNHKIKLCNYEYIFVYSREVGNYLNNIPEIVNATFVCISARVAAAFQKGQKTLYPDHPSEESMLALIKL